MDALGFQSVGEIAQELKKSAKYLGADCETGGIDLSTSLLTAYFAALDDEFKFLDELDLKIKPESTFYTVTAEGLGINKIDLVAHDKEAKTKKEVKTQLYEFLKVSSDNGKNKLILIGHGVKFDQDFLWTHLISQETWEQFVSYRVIDTVPIARCLIDVGIIPKTVRGSLASLCDYFKITVPGTDFHTGKGDTLRTVLLYKKMLEILKGLELDAKLWREHIQK